MDLSRKVVRTAHLDAPRFRRSIRGDKFVGCAFDEDNQPELSEERAKNWVAQIKGEGITI